MEEDEERETSDSETTLKYPYAVFFIVGNEFCERFCFYGMRTILTIYATTILLYSDNSATVLFHSFIVGCYFTPVFGAIIADSYWGKFKTIFYISVIYVIGIIVIAVGAIPATLYNMRATTLAGLVLIAVGTGGIKPCVSAFGGDQFDPRQEKQLQQFFSVFYLSINLGSVISTFLTPILRADVHCFGEDTCFSLAFGVPAVLMITALLIFLIGKRMYKMVPPQRENVIVTVFKCIGHALAQKWKQRRSPVKKPHWLDYAEDRYGKNLRQDIKDLLHVLFLYIPLPMFWALFDQQGSRWTIQATRMNGDISKYYQIKPDQMQVINPFLIIVFIPLFEYWIYPLLRKCHILRKPLQRITTGGLFAASAFVVAGILEARIQQDLPVPIKPGFGELVIINNSPCKMVLSGSFNAKIPAFENYVLKDFATGESYKWTFIPQSCPYASSAETWTTMSKAPFEVMMITTDGGKVKLVKVEALKKKPKKGFPNFKIFYRLNYVFQPNGTATFEFKSDTENVLINPNVTEATTFGITNDVELLPSQYRIYLPINDSSHEKDPIGSVHLGWGATYVISIYQDEKNSSLVTQRIFNFVKPSTVPMLYQVPQYVLITAGEIMFSITGLEFSYSQSPISMKSVLQAAWLMTVSMGDGIVVVVAEARIFENQAYEFFMFAVLMALDMLVFAIFAYFYKYVTVRKDSDW